MITDKVSTGLPRPVGGQGTTAVARGVPPVAQLPHDAKAAIDYCQDAEYVSEIERKQLLEVLSTDPKFASSMSAEVTVTMAFHKHERSTCPACGTNGWYRWYWLGCMMHTPCESSWYASPGLYAWHAVKSGARTGASAGAEASAEAQKKGEGGTSDFWFIGFIVGYFMIALRIVCGGPLNFIAWVGYRIREAKKKSTIGTPTKV